MGQLSDSTIVAMTPQLIALATIVVMATAVVAGPPSPAPDPAPSPTTSKPSPTASPAPRPETLEDVDRRLDVIMNNTRSRENYIRCFMDKGICNREANAIKKILGDALSSNCSKCSDRERAGAARFVEYLKSKQPETWTKMEAKYGGGSGKGAAAANEAGKGKGINGKGNGKGPAAASSEGVDASESDTDDDDDDDDEKEKKTKSGEKKMKDGGASGKQAKHATAHPKASVSMIF